MLRSYLLRSLCFFFLVACGIFQLRFAIQEQLTFIDQSEKLEIEQLRNPRSLTLAAKKKHVFDADLVSAHTLLKRALTYNPIYVPAWLSLAELYNDKGENNRIDEVLRYTDVLTKDIKRWRWEKTLAAYQLGRMDILPGELQYIIHEIPGKTRNDALNLAYSLWKEPQELLENVGLENLIFLFNYSLRQNFADDSLYFWRILEKEKKVLDQKDLLFFLEKLIQNEKILEALEIWRKHFGENNNIYNGDFSKKITQRAFGWRSIDHKGVTHRFESSALGNDSRVLHYRFKGWSNIDYYHFYQIVPLDAGKKYELSGEMKSHKLTTDQRPFWEIYGYKCKAEYAKSDMVAPDQEWTEFLVEFGVPQKCAAMIVRLRRKESNQLDNKISGKLWLKNFSISEIADDYTILDDLQ